MKELKTFLIEGKLYFNLATSSELSGIQQTGLRTKGIMTKYKAKVIIGSLYYPVDEIMKIK